MHVFYHNCQTSWEYLGVKGQEGVMGVRLSACPRDWEARFRDKGVEPAGCWGGPVSLGVYVWHRSCLLLTRPVSVCSTEG